MKKINLLLIAIGIAFSGFAQAVSDNATIPLSVTLNTILRLNVTSGGNIEFAFNTIEDYENGISNTTRYTTTFTVASSNDFDVTMSVDDATFFGTDDVNHTMALGYVAYNIVFQGGGTTGTLPAAMPFQLNGTNLIVDGGVAGDIADNEYDIEWECGTTNTLGSLLGSAVAPDRYATNIALILSGD
jgi:TRAP-type mannitol/chloroaromatic compound transport system substrate-binding protein